MIKSSDHKKPADPETRDIILDAATQLFAQKGLNGTTTREIAALAKVNIAALHYHWGGKEDLLTAVYQKVIQEVGMLSLHLMSGTETDLREVLEKVLTELHDFFAKNSNYARILMYEDLEDPEFLKDIREQTLIPIIQQVSEYLRKLMKQGKIRKVDPEVALVQLYGAFMHSFMGGCAQRIIAKLDDSKTSKRFKDQFIDLVLTTFGITK